MSETNKMTRVTVGAPQRTRHKWIPFATLILVVIAGIIALNFERGYHHFIPAVSAPEELSVVQVDGNYTLSWSKCKGIDGYKIYSFDGRYFNEIASVDKTTTYFDTKIVSERYAVRSFKKVFFWEDKSDDMIDAYSRKVSSKTFENRLNTIADDRIIVCDNDFSEVEKELKDNSYLYIRGELTDKEVNELSKIATKKQDLVVASKNTDLVKLLAKKGVHTAVVVTPKIRTDIYFAIDAARDNGADGVLVKYSDYVSESFVKIAHKSGLKFGCFNIKNNVQRTDVMDLGVDFVIDDNPFLTKGGTV